jgi:intraflagellar transport protein 140
MSLTGLARAAVAGDERALDLFSSWRPPASHGLGVSGSGNAYAGSARGVVYCLSENGSCMEVGKISLDGIV